jgi:hypothetical protein
VREIISHAGTKGSGGGGLVDETDKMLHETKSTFLGAAADLVNEFFSHEGEF